MQHGDVTIASATDNAFLRTQSDVDLIDPQLRRRIRLKKSNSLTTVVWNPWREGAARLGDLGDGEWTQFLCVEASNILNSIRHSGARRGTQNDGGSERSETVSSRLYRLARVQEMSHRQVPIGCHSSDRDRAVGGLMREFWTAKPLSGKDIGETPLHGVEWKITCDLKERGFLGARLSITGESNDVA